MDLILRQRLLQKFRLKHPPRQQRNKNSRFSHEWNIRVDPLGCQSFGRLVESGYLLLSGLKLIAFSLVKDYSSICIYVTQAIMQSIRSLEICIPSKALSISLCVASQKNFPIYSYVRSDFEEVTMKLGCEPGVCSSNMVFIVQNQMWPSP
jgi:hypothetical protein